MKDSSRVEQAKPLLLQALKSRAKVYHRLGCYDAGMADLKAAIGIARGAAARAEVDLLIADNLTEGPCDYHQAKLFILKVLRAAAKTGHLKLRSEGLSSLSNVYMLLGDNRRAKTCLYKARPYIIKTNDRHGLARIYNGLGTVFAKLGFHDKAMKYFRRSLAECTRQKLIQDDGFVSNEIGLLFQERSDFSNASEYFERALAKALQAGDKRLAAVVQSNIGIICALTNDFPRALTYFKQYLAVCREIGFLRGIGTVSGNIGNILFMQGETMAALKHMKQHLSIATRISFKNDMSLASYNLGILYCALGAWTRARAAYHRSLNIARGSRDKVSTGYARIGLAEVEIETGNLTVAEKNLAKARQCFAEVGDKVRLAVIQCHRARIDCIRGNPGRALMRARTAQATIAGLGEQDFEINCLRITGIALLAQARAEAEPGRNKEKSGLASAEKYISSALQMSQDKGLRLETAKSQMELARIYLAQGRRQEAKKNLLAARKIFARAQAKPWLAKVRKLIDET